MGKVELLSRRRFLRLVSGLGAGLLTAGIDGVRAQDGTPTPAQVARESGESSEISGESRFDVSRAPNGSFELLAYVKGVDNTEYTLGDAKVLCSLVLCANPELQGMSVNVPLVIWNQKIGRLALGDTIIDASLIPDPVAAAQQSTKPGGRFEAYTDGTKIFVGFDVDRQGSLNSNAADSSYSINAIVGDWIASYQTSSQLEAFLSSKALSSLTKINDQPFIVPYAVSLAES
jgi:hypothetical protein